MVRKFRASEVDRWHDRRQKADLQLLEMAFWLSQRRSDFPEYADLAVRVEQLRTELEAVNVLVGDSFRAARREAWHLTEEERGKVIRR